MRYESPLTPATLVRRYKRFLADVELETGEVITVHTANTGSMTGCAIPGTRVWIRDSGNPKRKYRFSWELASTVDGIQVGINTAMANKLVKEAIESGVIAELAGFQSIKAEQRYGLQGSRIDLLLDFADGRSGYVEVKNVTASFEPGIAAFPDAVTQRGTRHLQELDFMSRQGHRAILVFCVQRSDIQSVRAAVEIDPVYARALGIAAKAGVEVLAYGAMVSPQAIALNRKLEVCLNRG